MTTSKPFLHRLISVVYSFRMPLLQAPEPVLEGLITLWIVFTAANLLLYWVVVCPVLYRSGARFPTGLMPWRYFHDLRGYQMILAAEGKSSNRYYILLFLTWFNILLGIGIVGYSLSLSKESPSSPLLIPGRR